MDKKRLNRKAYHNSKIFMSILRSVILIIPIPIIVIIIVELSSLYMIEQTVDNFEEQIIDRVLGEVQQNFAESYQVIYQVKKDDTILNYVKKKERDYWEEREVLEQLGKILSGHDNIEELYIYFQQFDYVISTRVGMDSYDYHMNYYKNSYSEWKNGLSNGWRGKFQIILGRDQENKSTLSSSMGSGSEPFSAQVVIQLNNDYLDKILQGLCAGKGEQAFLYTESGILGSTCQDEQEGFRELLGENVGSAEFEGEVEGVTYNFMSKTSQKTGVTLFYASPREMKHEAVIFVKVIGVIVSVVCGILLLLLSFVVAHKNYRPIWYLFNNINEIETGLAIKDYVELEDYVKKSVHTRDALGRKVKEYEEDVIGFNISKALFQENETSFSPEKLMEWGFTGNYFLVLLCVFETAETVERYGNGAGTEAGERTWRKDILYAYIKECFPQLGRSLVLKHNGKYYCVLNGNGYSEEQFRHLLMIQSEKMKKNLEEMEGLLCETYLGEGFDSIAKLYQSYEDVNARWEEELSSELLEIRNDCSIESITEIIKNELSDVNLSVAVIAQRLSITPSHLSRFFKMKMGIGVLEYIHQCRITMAKEMLKEQKDLRVKEVALTTGFYNVSTFIRVFKKVEGVTPGQYREMHV
ncbi:MAG: AraC family transcriptional regulator [Clostridia bacterium]|nr:AraC family transcriptional regulator [Clostridia bacterium]NCC42971.1 AraC family transcriptional regulator [Clostridia bacterium]